MNQKPEMNAAEIERLLISMSASNTLNVEMTDADFDMLVSHVSSAKQAELSAARAMAKMEEAQHKREQRLPTFMLAQYIAKARLSSNLTLAQVADQAEVTENAIDELERGSWTIVQVIQQFPPQTMIRILTAIRVAVQDFSDELADLANNASLKLAQSSVYARSRPSLNTKSAHLEADVARYIDELQRLSM